MLIHQTKKTLKIEKWYFIAQRQLISDCVFALYTSFTQKLLINYSKLFKKFLISTLIFSICALCSHASDLFDYVKNSDVSALKASVNSKNADLKNSNDESLLHVAVKEKKYELFLIIIIQD